MTLKSGPKKSWFFRNAHFLCDAKDFDAFFAFFVWCIFCVMQSVKGTLKVLEKSLITVLDEVHLIFNLCIFFLSLVHQANLSFLKVSHLPPFKAEQLLKLPPLFLLNPLCWGYLNSQVRINKIVAHLSSKISLILSYFYTLLMDLSLSRMLIEFSLKFLYSNLCG